MISTARMIREILSFRAMCPTMRASARRFQGFCMRRLASLFLSLAVMASAVQAASPAEDLAHARRLLARSILFDGHNDLPWAIRTDKAHPNDVVAYDLRRTVPG